MVCRWKTPWLKIRCTVSFPFQQFHLCLLPSIIQWWQKYLQTHPLFPQGDGNQHNRCLHPDALTPPLQDICWSLNSVFRWCLFSFSSITILYVYNFSWFYYLKIKWKMSPPRHWHNHHNKNFHPEKSGKKKFLGPTFVPMEWILAAKRTVKMGEWVNLE